jgi:hypothetical protein
VLFEVLDSPWVVGRSKGRKFGLCLIGGANSILCQYLQECTRILLDQITVETCI